MRLPVGREFAKDDPFVASQPDNVIGDYIFDTTRQIS
jgi:hypothetical protein